MSIPNDGTSERPAATKWNEELVFAVLASRPRRKLMVALVDREARSGGDLIPAGKGVRTRCTRRLNYLDSTTKHLKLLIDAGMVVQSENKEDRRRPLYALHPNVTAERNGDDIVFDFGFVVARIDPDGN